MGKFSTPKKPNWFLRIILGIILILILLVGCVWGYIWSKLDKITYADEIPTDAYSVTEALGDTSTEPEDDEYQDDYVVDIGGLETEDAPPTVPDAELNEHDNVMNILLIGTDERTTHYNAKSRADSMILVSINKDKNTVRLVSLERGIGVPILAGKYEGEYDLLTHIFRWGGADLLIDTVEYCFNVQCDHYVRLNFAAVKDIVDAVGGVDIELSAAEAGHLGLSYHINSTTGKQQPLRVGVNHLDGGNALAYARLRSIDSDWQRVGRQRKVILAVVDALKGSTIWQLNNLADTVLPLIQTNLTKLEISELLLYAPHFLTSEFDQMTIPKQGTYGGMNIRLGAGAFAVDYEINNEILRKFLYEGVSSEELLAN